MKRIALFVALTVALLAGCQSVPPPAAGMAALRIRVIAERKAGAAAPDERGSDYEGAAPRVARAFERVDYAALDEIVIWVEPLGNGAAAAVPAPVVIEVEARKSDRHLSRAVSIGQRIILHNRGDRAGNFYSVSDGNAFDAGTIPPGGQAAFTARAAGAIEILSDAWRDPVAEIYAAPSRWVSLTQSGASVDFPDLPPGRYKIASWHPRLPGYELTITLSPNQIGAATIKVGVNALPKVGIPR